MGDESSTIVFVKGMGELVKTIAGDYKNTYFVIIGEAVENGENLGSFVYNNDEVDFIQGAVATLLTSNNTIGFIAEEAKEILKKSEVAFTGGRNKINPDARLYNNVKDRDGSLEEIIQFMVSIGVDVIGPYGSEPFLGDVLTLTRQNKVALVGNNAIDFEKNKDVVMPSVELKAEDFIFKTIENANNKIFNGTVQQLGANEDAIIVSYSPDFSNKITDTVKTSVNDLLKAIKNNEVDINSYLVW